MGGLINSVNSAVHGLTGIDLTGGYAAQQGLQAQQNAASQANALQSQIYNDTKNNIQPYQKAGTQALSQLTGNLGYYEQPFTMAQFHQDPGYQFDLQQGQQAIQRSAAVQGGLVSGGQLAALNNYSQNMANNEYQQALTNYQNQQQNSFNRLMSLTSIGQNANSTLAGAGQSYAGNVGNNLMGAANAQAAYGQQQQAQTMSMLGTAAGLYAGSQGWNSNGGSTNAATSSAPRMSTLYAGPDILGGSAYA